MMAPTRAASFRRFMDVFPRSCSMAYRSRTWVGPSDLWTMDAHDAHSYYARPVPRTMANRPAADLSSPQYASLFFVAIDRSARTSGVAMQAGQYHRISPGRPVEDQAA